MVDLPESNLCNECNWMWNHPGWLHFLWLREASDLTTAGCSPRESRNSACEPFKKSDGNASPCGQQARKGLASWHFCSGRGTYKQMVCPEKTDRGDIVLGSMKAA